MRVLGWMRRIDKKMVIPVRCGILDDTGKIAWKDTCKQAACFRNIRIVKTSTCDWARTLSISHWRRRPSPQDYVYVKPVYGRIKDWIIRPGQACLECCPPLGRYSEASGVPGREVD